MRLDIVNSESVLLMTIDLDEYNLDKPMARDSIISDIALEVRKAKERGES